MEIICILCARKVVNHHDRYLVEGNSKVNVKFELDSLSIAAYFKEHNEVILKTGSILFGKFEEKCSVC